MIIRTRTSELSRNWRSTVLALMVAKLDTATRPRILITFWSIHNIFKFENSILHLQYNREELVSFVIFQSTPFGLRYWSSYSINDNNRIRWYRVRYFWRGQQFNQLILLLVHCYRNDALRILADTRETDQIYVKSFSSVP